VGELAHLAVGREEHLRGYCDGERWTVTPGIFVFLPRDRPHGFTVIGDEPARALVIVGPARLDGQVAATGVAVPGRPRRLRP
jgi:quercetin dioxygenase-like cupin family protein